MTYSPNIFGDSTLRADGVTRPMSIGLNWGEGGTAVTGIEALIQKVTKHLLTSRVLYDMEFGGFLQEYRVGRTLQNMAAIIPQVFAAAAAACKLQLTEVVGLGRDEQLDSVALTDWDIDYAAGFLNLTVRVTNMAGEATTFKLPLTTLGN